MNYQRLGLSIQTKLAAIELDLGRVKEVSERLTRLLAEADCYQDRRARAKIKRLLARLYTIRGDFPAAHTALEEAIDLFERLGMRRELAETRAELAQLDAGMAPAAGPAESSADGAELSWQASATLVE